MSRKPKAIESVEPEPEPVIVQTTRKPMPGPVDTMYSRLGQLAAPKLAWYHCREQFHNSMPHAGPIPDGFYFTAHSIHNVGMLFDWLERALNIKPKMRSKLYRCGDGPETPCFQTTRNSPRGSTAILDETIYVDLSPFWKTDHARFFFATIVCKASISSPIFHPLDAILATHYCTSTRLATAKFLDGYTLRGGDIKATNNANVNWVWQFSNAANSEKLVKPEGKSECIYFIGGDPSSKLSADEREKVQAWVREYPHYSKFKY